MTKEPMKIKDIKKIVTLTAKQQHELGELLEGYDYPNLSFIEVVYLAFELGASYTPDEQKSESLCALVK